MRTCRLTGEWVARYPGTGASMDVTMRLPLGPLSTVCWRKTHTVAEILLTIRNYLPQSTGVQKPGYGFRITSGKSCSVLMSNDKLTVLDFAALVPNPTFGPAFFFGESQVPFSLSVDRSCGPESLPKILLGSLRWIRFLCRKKESPTP